MPDKLYAERRELILRSMDDIEQGRMQYIEIRYFTGDKEIEITVKGWEKYDPKKANEIY